MCKNISPSSSFEMLKQNFSIVILLAFVACAMANKTETVRAQNLNQNPINF